MDKHGDVGSVASVAEFSTVAVSMPSGDETLMENRACEGQIDGESYNGGDGEEIMIEVVGSDVFVDGVSSHRDGLGKEGLGGDRMESFVNEGVIGGDVGSREVGELGDQLWDGRTVTGMEEFQEFSGVLDESSSEVVEKQRVEVVPGSTGEKMNVVGSPSVEVSVREEGDCRVSGAGEVPGEAKLVDEGDKGPGNLAQGTGVLDDVVWNPGIDAVHVSSSVMLETESEEGKVVQKEGSKMDEEDLGRTDDILAGDVVRDGSQSLGKEQSSVAQMTGMVSEASDKHSLSCVNAEIPNSPAKADVMGHVVSVSTEGSLPPGAEGTETNADDQDLHSSGEDRSMKDNMATDNIASHGKMGVGTVSFSELPDDNAGGDVASVDSNVYLADSLDTVGQHALAGKYVSAGTATDVVSGTEPEYSISRADVEQGEIPAGGNVQDSGVEPETPFSYEKNETIIRSEDFLKEETVCGSHGDLHAAPESSVEQSSVVERGEWIAMDFDEVLNFKDEAILMDAPDASLCSVGNTEEHSGKPIIIPHHGDSAAKAATVPDESHAKDIKPKLDFRGDDGLVQSDLGISKEHKQVAGEYTEVLTNYKGANLRGEVSDGNEPVQNNEQFNTLEVTGGAEKKVIMEANSVSSSGLNGNVIPMETSIQSQVAVEIPVCDAFDRQPLLAEVNDNVEKDGVLSSDPKEDAEVEIPCFTLQGIDSNAEVNTGIQDDKTEVAAPLSETLTHEVHVDQTKDSLIFDEIQNEVAHAASVSNVQVSAGSESAGVSGCFLGEGDIANLLSDGNGNANVDYVSHGTVHPNGDQTDRTSGSDAVDQLMESKSECCHSHGNDMMQVDIREIKSSDDQKDIGGGKQCQDDGQVDHREPDLSSAENVSEADLSKRMEEKTAKLPSFLSIHQDGYFLPPENEGEFSITDLVWGKVRSHPWWPGQIFDPANASEKAIKYHKKDCFLVAYFGDRTFAWNDASLLKPFRPHFSHIEKQSNSEAFQNAVSCALNEVKRRVELGLSCFCVPRDAYDKIECQIVENTGIQEESSRRSGVDKSTAATSFEPDKLLQYVRSLAESPFCLVDRLELVLAQAQLSAFCRFKGYREPPAFEQRDATFESDAMNLASSHVSDESVLVGSDEEQLSSSHKRRHSLKDNLQPRKERSLSELMSDMEYSPDCEDYSDSKAQSKSVATTSGKKRKAVDSLTDASDRRTTFYAAKVSTTSSSPKPFFKVGDCIRRVASQLTGSAPVLKGHNDQAGIDTSLPVSEDSQQVMTVVPTEISSMEEMLSQLQLAARDPNKGYNFLSNIVVFFSGFRNSVVRKHTSVGRSCGGRKRKANHATGGSTEEFEFDDVNDSYWTDRIVQNYSEEQLLQNNENGDRDYQLVVAEPNRVHKSGRGSSRKRYSTGNYEMPADEQSEDVDRKKLEVSPAELVLTFAERDRLPSEINLNKMFRRFGPLKESETEVHHDSRRARVIFKRGADAEVACSSAGRINIFGSMVVSYQLIYSPSDTTSPLPLLMLEGLEEAT